MTTTTTTSRITRTGTLRSPNATRSGYVNLLVRELEDGTIEYLVGDAARRRDGWATLGASLVADVEWEVRS